MVEQSLERVGRNLGIVIQKEEVRSNRSGSRLIAGGSEPTIFAVPDEDDLRELAGDHLGSAIRGGIVGNNHLELRSLLGSEQRLQTPSKQLLAVPVRDTHRHFDQVSI
jgi:hypothetical protein